MGFLDKAKQMADQAQQKLDEAQQKFNESQRQRAAAGQGGQAAEAVHYDSAGRRVQSAPPPGEAPGGAVTGPVAPAAPAAPAEGTVGAQAAVTSQSPAPPVDLASEAPTEIRSASAGSDAPEMAAPAPIPAVPEGGAAPFPEDLGAPGAESAPAAPASPSSAESSPAPEGEGDDTDRPPPMTSGDPLG